MRPLVFGMNWLLRASHGRVEEAAGALDVVVVTEDFVRVASDGIVGAQAADVIFGPVGQHISHLTALMDEEVRPVRLA
jgi:hypothetical protein